MPTNDGNIVKRNSQYLDNLEHDETTGAKGVVLYGTPDGTTIYRLKVNSDGSIPVTVVAGGGGGGGATKATALYEYIQKDTADLTHKYYGYMDDSGAWVIKQIDRATNLALFAVGASGYTAAWTARTSGTYADYGTVF